MVRKTVIAAIALFAFMGIANAQTWKFDQAHSQIGFIVRHMVVSKVHGNFTEMDGEITYDGKDLSKAVVSVTVQSKSINTDNEKRDGHLRSADFFAVDSFQTLTFVSTKIVPGEGDKFQMTGNLTIRGIAKEVTFDCTNNGTVSAFGGERAGFSATATINRKDFNVNWSKQLDGGGLVVSDNVVINIEVEAVKAQ